jgi:hypothetical protein
MAVDGNLRPRGDCNPPEVGFDRGHVPGAPLSRGRVDGDT